MRNARIFEKIDSYTITEEFKKIGRYPFFREIISEQDTEVLLKGNRKVLMLGSNSYMGLTTHPEVKEAAVEALKKYGTGCAGSRFLNGTLDLHEELEGELAAWVGKDAAMVFSTGFQTNQGLIATILTRRDHVIMDKFDHASIIDGALLSMAKVSRYAHNDNKDLKRVLSQAPAEAGKFIITEGIFSMDGDIVKLPELVSLAEEYDAAVMIDDAHSLGVLGPNGSGAAAHFGLTEKIDFIMGTFSKSLASVGGFIASDKQTIEYLKHHSRAYIFSASLPASATAAALAALRIIQREPERIEHLWKVTRMMREGLQALGYDTRASESPVIPVYIGDIMLMVNMNKRLEEEGVFINPVPPPAVPPNECLIRISLMATHTEKQVEFGLQQLEKVGKELGII